MSIAYELSSEVAAAVLADKEGETPLDASGRAEVVLEVHSTLRRLSAEYRRHARREGRDEQPAAALRERRGGVEAARG